MRSEDYMPDSIILRDVHMGNETTDKIIVFTKADLSYICKQYFNPKTPKRLTCISQYIYTWRTRRKQTAKKRQRSKIRSRQSEIQPRLLPRSQKGVGVRALQEELLEGQRSEETPSEKPQVQAAASYGDRREVQRNRINNRISSRRGNTTATRPYA